MQTRADLRKQLKAAEDRIQLARFEFTAAEMQKHGLEETIDDIEVQELRLAEDFTSKAAPGASSTTMPSTNPALPAVQRPSVIHSAKPPIPQYKLYDSISAAWPMVVLLKDGWTEISCPDCGANSCPRAPNGLTLVGLARQQKTGRQA